jgi:hypothetical protein
MKRGKCGFSPRARQSQVGTGSGWQRHLLSLLQGGRLWCYPAVLRPSRSSKWNHQALVVLTNPKGKLGTRWNSAATVAGWEAIGGKFLCSKRGCRGCFYRERCPMQRGGSPKPNLSPRGSFNDNSIWILKSGGNLTSLRSKPIPVESGRVTARARGRSGDAAQKQRWHNNGWQVAVDERWRGQCGPNAWRQELHSGKVGPKMGCVRARSM